MYNKLTDAQVEQLAALAEEMGEAIQIIGKILRHGYEEFNPFDPTHTPNRQLLEKELGDTAYWINKMMRLGELDAARIGAFRVAKFDSVAPYLHHNDPES